MYSSFKFIDFYALILCIGLWVCAMFFAIKIEKIKKHNDIQTYKEIVAFTEGKRLDELKKIVRVMRKYDETAPHEIMLTLDAGTGQNAISQAKLFNEAVGLTGITLTKLDGTAKGGVIFAIADQFNLPIRYIGVGEKIEDLREFNAEEFIEALFVHENEE